MPLFEDMFCPLCDEGIQLYCHQHSTFVGGLEKCKRLLAIYHWSRSRESIWQSWKWILVPKKGILESINQKLFSSSFAVWRRTFWKTVPLADFTSHLRQNATREIILAAWEMPKPQFSSTFLMVCIIRCERSEHLFITVTPLQNSHWKCHKKSEKNTWNPHSFLSQKIRKNDLAFSSLKYLKSAHFFVTKKSGKII